MSLALQRTLILTTTVFLLACVYLPSVRAQSEQPQPQATPLPAPPPLKVITKEERGQLDQTKDQKDRLKLTIDLAVTHLTRAEQLTMQTEYEKASEEVGSYHALIENALGALGALKQDSGKTRDLYKRLEMALRAHGPRLTAMRRVTPLEFAVWIKKAEDFARDGRTEALNSFYGHTVLREQKSAEKPEDKPKETPTPTPKSKQQ
ncbi:MAG TPA: hypothetical protein VJP89_07040 [Pyrinomonadaceae bacterium]|jgi:hypothetical protein|nr:hypothetical protein [Pyrinomonadaceae bacterium]